MQTVPVEQKLVIILEIAFLLKEKINQIIDPISKRSHINSDLLKELQDLRINEFINSSRKALSEFNASTCENSPLSIRVKRIIEEFTEIKVLINPRVSTPKRTFFSNAAAEVDLQRLRKNLTAINEVFNMLPEKTPHQAIEQYSRPAPGA
ncbi:hypothetical protein [Rickettsiella endosymbiont of Miltochrista miniata]|uniref:hypothetical protein n=1 Tax=Rickettsiella endosymbiont of Miltochrista miniata TaxID=3066239 RepID=UPI00313DCB31